MRRTLALYAALVLPACSPNAGVVGCEDFVEVMGDKAEECGFDREANEDAAEDGATMGMGCRAVVDLRDPDAFYDECLPYLRGLTCAELDNPDVMIPPSCSMQILVRAP